MKTPGRYGGAEEIEAGGISFEEKMSELSSELYEQFTKVDQLDLPTEALAQAEATIKKNLEALGYGQE